VLTVHTALVRVENVTPRPDDAVADNVRGAGEKA